MKKWFLNFVANLTNENLENQEFYIAKFKPYKLKDSWFELNRIKNWNYINNNFIQRILNYFRFLSTSFSKANFVNEIFQKGPIAVSSTLLIRYLSIMKFFNERERLVLYLNYDSLSLFVEYLNGMSLNLG